MTFLLRCRAISTSIDPILQRNIQVRVLGEALLHSAESQLSGEISLRGKQLVDTKSSALSSNHACHLLNELRVEGASYANGRVEDGAIEDQDTMKTLTLDKGRDT